ncbi:hypothetical protein SSCHL_1789 [Staphylococcus schleiferi]|nr:hypothetical protein SSCHL_1789 [Staphylococcus schleiferi]
MIENVGLLHSKGKFNALLNKIIANANRGLVYQRHPRVQ